MVMCFAPDCKHYSERDGCRFFVFPKDATDKKRWISLLRRKDREPSLHSLVCHCHFVDGDRRNGPTIFNHNKTKRFVIEPSTSKRNPKKQRKQSVEPLMPGTSHDDQSIPSTSSVEKSPLMPGTSHDDQSIPSTSSVEKSPLMPGTSQEDQSIPDADEMENLKEFQLTACLEAENYFLKKNLEEAKNEIKMLSTRFSFKCIDNSNEQILLYTGLPAKEIFECLYELMDSYSLKYYQGWPVITVPKVDQLLLTLMKLKLNLVNEDLATRFNISSKTVANIFYTWLYALHEIIYKKLMDRIPSRHQNQLCMPSCFSSFTNCRVILDCTEVYCMQPGNMDKQKATYSSYKHRNTLKGLIGVAPNGVVTYVSELYPGSVSDKKIVKHCGILNQLVAGDLVIADKGFLISDILPSGVSLNIPPFLTTPQFTPQQVIQTRTIAKARIHVERAIIPSNLLPHATEVFQVCAALTNFQFPLIREVEGLYSSADE